MGRVTGVRVGHAMRYDARGGEVYLTDVLDDPRERRFEAPASAVSDLEWRRALAEAGSPLACDAGVPWRERFAFEVRRDGVAVFVSLDPERALVEASRVSGGKAVVEVHLVAPRVEGPVEPAQEAML